MGSFPEPGARGAAVIGNDSTVKSVEKLSANEELRLKDFDAAVQVAHDELEAFVSRVEKASTAAQTDLNDAVGDEAADLSIEKTAQWDRHRGDPEIDNVCLDADVVAGYAEDHDPERARERMQEPRKYRSHANAKSETTGERRFDTTALHYDQHGRLFSHADYIAHCEKYDYVWRWIKKGDRILDVGCGTDAPLMRAINFVQSSAAKVLYREGGCYVGVDMNKLKTTNINWAELIGELDATSDEGYDMCLRAIPENVDDENDIIEEPRGYSLIVCLEVIEHMGLDDGRKMLENFRDLLSADGQIILSTPVYDGKGMARNHIHEYYVDELRQLIEESELKVVRRMGTFTAEPQIKRWMKANRPDWLELYVEAREFHSAGYMSGVIAPMVPDMARNNVWVIKHADE